MELRIDLIEEELEELKGSILSVMVLIIGGAYGTL